MDGQSEQVRLFRENLLGVTQGKFFGIEWTKKGGEIRSGVFRLGVKSYLQSISPEESAVYSERLANKGYMIAFDIQKKGYRSIDISTVSRITFAGQAIVGEPIE